MSTTDQILAITFDFTGTLAYFNFHPSHSGFQLFDETLATLQELKSRGYKLGVISNAGSELNDLLVHLGIRSYFDVIIASQEWGIQKPNPKIFEIALTKLGVANHQTLHVGDSMIDDIEGAENMGMACLLVNRNLVHAMESTIPSLRDLLELLPTRV